MISQLQSLDPTTQTPSGTVSVILKTSSELTFLEEASSKAQAATKQDLNLINSLKDKLKG